MSNVKIKWTGEGQAPETVTGAGFSLKAYKVKNGVAEVDARDLYTVLNRRPGEWGEVKNVSVKRATTETESDSSSAGNDAS